MPHLAQLDRRAVGLGDIAAERLVSGEYVALQPVSQEAEDFDADAHSACAELLLQFGGLPGQRRVLGLMVDQLRIRGRAHEAFLVGEVRASVGYQAIKNLIQDLSGGPAGHSFMKLIEQGNQNLVLGVDGEDAGGI